MKKYFSIIMVSLFLMAGVSNAEVFNNLSNLSPAQKEQLTQVHEQYKKANNEIETQIMSYNAKIAKLKQESDKSASDIQMLSNAYQRNIDSLKAEQDRLNKKLDDDYKAILTEEQFNQYQLQKDFAQNAFTNFLPK